MIAAAAAVLVVAYLVRRWRKLSGERKALGIVIALALAVYASGVLSELPDPKKVIGDIAEALGPWTYALVGLLAFLETGAFVGLIAPGETVVIAGGVIAGQGEIQLLPLIGLVWACAVAGDTTSFYIGRRLGRPFLERHGPRLKITHERLEQVEGYFDRHGGKTILIGRFIGLVRALAPFIAGSSGLPYRRFVPYSIVGTGLWATTFCGLGYIFWRSFDKVAHYAGQAIFGFGVTVSLIVGIVVAYRRRREIRDWLVEHQRHPLIRPLFAVGRPLYRWLIRPVARLLGPYARFTGQRLMPGELGLELTTLLAIGGIGIFFFVLYWTELDPSLAPTPFDNDILDLARQAEDGRARRHREGGNPPRRVPDRGRPRDRDHGAARRAAALRGGDGAGGGTRARLHRRARVEGGARPAAAFGSARLRERRRLSERPRGLRDRMGRRRGRADPATPPGDQRDPHLHRDRDRRGRRALAGLPARRTGGPTSRAGGASVPGRSHSSAQSSWSSSTSATMGTCAAPRLPRRRPRAAADGQHRPFNHRAGHRACGRPDRSSATWR